MKKIFEDNLKSGLLLGILATILMLIRGFVLIGAIVGIFGFIKSRKAVKEGKLLGVIGAILSILPILYTLFLIFILGYVFTRR